MAIRWKVKAMKNPKTGDVNYYAQIATRNKCDFETLADEIEALTSLSAGDALNMLRTMQRLIINHLKNNDTVAFDQLGTFVPTITSRYSRTADAVGADNIKRVRIRFLNGSGLRRAFDKVNLTFAAAKEEEAGD